MAAQPFEDRQNRLFGRRADRDRLAGRARTTKGLTAVLARPQAGKTWLLTEVARYLTEDAAPPVLVGYAEQLGQTSDLLLRAVANLYDRWLSHASTLDQVRRAWKKEKRQLFGQVAAAVTKILKEATPTGLKPIAVVAEEAIGGLLRAKQELATGGLQLPKLDYDLARELVAVVAALSGLRVVLILDAWEQSPNCDGEAKTIAAILRHLDAWPEVHLFVASRPEHPASRLIADWEAEFPAATTEQLDRWPLGDGERARLVAYLHHELPAAARLADADLLDLVDEHAGVIGRWTDAPGRQRLADTADFAGIAQDAHTFRYREFNVALPALDAADLRLATRLALLPMTADSVAWPRLEPLVLSGCDAARLDHLVLARVLERSDPPGYGHAKRHEVALAWLLDHHRLTVRAEAEMLISAFAAQVGDRPDLSVPQLAAISAIGSNAAQTMTSCLCRGLVTASAILMGLDGNVDDVITVAAHATEYPFLSKAAEKIAWSMYQDAQNRDWTTDDEQINYLINYIDRMVNLRKTFSDQSNVDEYTYRALSYIPILYQHIYFYNRENALNVFETLQYHYQQRPKDTALASTLARMIECHRWGSPKRMNTKIESWFRWHGLL